MSDDRDGFEGAVRGFDPSTDEGLERTLDRARRRHRRRQVLAGILAVGMFGATLAAAVALGGSNGRPIAGPTSSPSPSAEFVRVTDEATWICVPGFRGGRRCFARTGPAVEVASGTKEGVPWSLEAVTVLYQGPHLGRSADPDQVRWPFLCTEWRFGAEGHSLCYRQTSGASIAIEGVPMTALVSAPIAKGLQPTGTGPLFQDESEGFVPHTVGDIDGPVASYYGWTLAQTSRLVVKAGDHEEAEAVLAGPFPDLNTPLRWFIAFAFKEGETAALTAYAGEERLWTRTVPLHPPQD
jgi:hypothetical protein